ncbi:unnamed protein product [Orchesella dallaii]|uniref:Uncharacterized protein n=1 Tax=Orchesella dallaii TaxID=48710 RepID=A0ABP1QRK2_9HEXA
MPYFTRKTTQNGALLDNLMENSLRQLRSENSHHSPSRPVETSSPGDLIPAEWLSRDVGGVDGEVGLQNVPSVRKSPAASLHDNASQHSGRTKSSSRSSKSQRIRILMRKSEELEKIEKAKDEAQMLVKALERKEKRVNDLYGILEEEGSGEEDCLSEPERDFFLGMNPVTTAQQKAAVPDSNKVENWLENIQQTPLMIPEELKIPPDGLEQAFPRTCSPLDALTHAITTAITAASNQKPVQKSEMPKLRKISHIKVKVKLTVKVKL